jgi:dihydroorotase-like cyclic amidohydrolase
VSLIIKGPMFVDGRVRSTAVRIDSGQIAAVADDVGTAERAIELAPRQVLLPAALDLLCGLRDWIAAPKETVEAATKGALAGGITVVCDQANIVPRLNVVPRVSERAQFVGERAYVDYGVAAAPPLDPADVERYREAGAYCIGLYSWNLRHWRYVRDLDDSEVVFRRYAEAGMPCSVVVDEAAFQETPLQEVGETYALEALLRRLDPGLRMRIQVTKPHSVDLILAAKSRLPSIEVQVPHHALSIDKDTAYAKIGSAARHHPPLRSAEEVARMKEYAADGKIDIFVSYHAPHRMQDKFATDPVPGELVPKAGFSTIDIAYPHFLTKLGIPTTCRGFCEAPARSLGLKKGRIAPGYDADLVIFEEDEGLKEQNMALAGGFTRGVWKVEPIEFYSMGKVTPFVGERLTYRTVKTFLRGEEAFDRATGTHRKLPIKRVECPR